MTIEIIGGEPSAFEIAVALPVYEIYTYRVADDLKSQAIPGKRVLAPFGRRKVTGYILGKTGPLKGKRLKTINHVLDEQPLFTSNMIPFFKWMSNYYKYPIGEVIKLALPSGINLYEQKTVSISSGGRHVLNRIDLMPSEREILELLAESSPLSVKELSETLKKKPPYHLIRVLEDRGWISSNIVLVGGKTKHRMQRVVSLASSGFGGKKAGLSSIKQKILEKIPKNKEISVLQLKNEIPNASRHLKSLENDGFIVVTLKKEFRDPLGESIPPDIPPVLTREQEEVISQILKKLDQGFRAYLLAGVTGSGKTEVYLRLSAEVIARKKSVLVLVPEIALISQMERRFRARFGESVAVLHSGLSKGERFDQWLKILSGEPKITIGARSAIFAPQENIGLIIVDEEHDTSYKQESSFRYNARDMAVVRAKMNGCTVILGSATPSVQSWFNVRAGKLRALYLKNRIEKMPLAEITVLDLKEKRGTRGMERIITPQLQQAMEKTLEKKEQVLLFLNRRGFASYPLCSNCGEPIRCDNCETTLTFHKADNAYKCHLCGLIRTPNIGCPSCGSPRIIQLGLGTEKLESMVKSLFPQARVARMDHDTTRRKGSIVRLLKALKNHSIDILIGTQMVAKGHDFPNITLVGIICADLSLNFPDFRAGERTFQTLAQVAGRAGRGRVPGKVILQSYNPNHFSILAARDQDFKRFYDKEITFREALNYPPFSRLVQLGISGKNKQHTESFAQDLGRCLRSLRQSDPDFEKVEMLGPIEAPLIKIAGRFRWQILLKSSEVNTLQRFVSKLVYGEKHRLSNRLVRVVVDVDPFDMM